ncbi:GntR family transcriptional regulator [Goodfellowiella coeruleoviolacea]|uniref:GntR family transcriptional regulator n=1 Tax=Goodfellowiella coeruleoviolacea TaxID=334858 RepID=A0AAE3GLJ1_9PSEU|nr:GntR family transcriptional regulator [Goodfellowiella coeruleoviolacea]MCP2169770.1 GntR family transcriptional regulator [Goodfellowiella coeruleoviolacea]
MDTKYGRIAAELRAAITSGQYSPGDTLPAIPELMERYHVARDTVRDAIRALSLEGLVTPLRGVGTVVRDTSPVALAYQPAAPARTWSEQHGASATDRVMSSGLEPADAEIAERLSLAPGTQVVHRIRHQSVGSGVVQIHDQWIPGTIAEAIRTTGGGDVANAASELSSDLFTLLARAGHAPRETTETISTRIADPDERDIMALPPEVPVLVTVRVTRDAAGNPVETSTFVGAGDRLSQSFTVQLDY